MAGGRPLHITWHADDTVEGLAQAVRQETIRAVARRLQVLWRLRQGDGIRVTARSLGVSERGVQRWVAWYRTGGLQAVRSHPLRGPGRRARLTDVQQEQVCAQRATGTVHTAWDALDWVTAQFGVSYRRKGIYSLLARLRCRPKVPRPTTPKSSPAIQAAWKKGGSSTPSPPPASRSPQG